MALGNMPGDQRFMLSTGHGHGHQYRSGVNQGVYGINWHRKYLSLWFTFIKIVVKTLG